MIAVDADADGVAALRDSASDHLDAFLGLLDLGALVGLAIPAVPEIREPLRRLDEVSVAGLCADAERLGAAYRTVSEQLNPLPEQTARVASGWVGVAGEAALGLVVAHQGRVGVDLSVLQSMATASAAVASGVDQILRTTYRSIAAISNPVVAGVPVAQVPTALLTGTVPPSAVAEDICARLRLYGAVTSAAVDSIDQMLGLLAAAAGQQPTVSEDAAHTSSRPWTPPDPARTAQPDTAAPTVAAPGQTSSSDETSTTDAQPPVGQPSAATEPEAAEATAQDHANPPNPTPPNPTPPNPTPPNSDPPNSDPPNSDSSVPTEPSSLQAGRSAATGQGEHDGQGEQEGTSPSDPDVPLLLPQQQGSTAAASEPAPAPTSESTSGGDLALAGDE